MREKAISAMLLVIAAIHFVPVSGFLGSAQLEALYGISIASSDLELLMRHRAVLFGIIASVIAYSAFRLTYQPLALLITAGSLFPFFYLLAVTENTHDAIAQIALGDTIAMVCLVGIVLLRYAPKLLSEG